MRRKSSSDTAPVRLLPWDAYLAGRSATQTYRECRSCCAPAFAHQRALIRRIVERTKPRVVACLGAGVLNDIPYRTLLGSGARLHLIDWLPGAIEAGIALSIIATDEAGGPHCAYCALAGDRARECCSNFHRSGAASSAVCDRFVPTPGDPPACDAFEIGSWPQVHVEDVTGGYASAFALGLGPELRGVTNWKQAFARANALARRIGRPARRRQRLNIADASVDLVTSSMLLTQFEHEPYDYFAKQVARLIGPPGTVDEGRLNRTMARLRDALVDQQVEEHCLEIRRILAPGGRVFMSFELFHIDPEQTDWFLVREMHRSLSALDRHFRFNFDLIGEGESLTRFQSRRAPSVVLALVLEAKTPAARH